MPIRIPDALPAHDILESENIFVMTEYRAMHQNIRPLNLLILNLMPTKIVTETQLLRMLPIRLLQIQVDFLQTASYTSTHTDIHHLQQFYYTFDQIRNRRYDGMIITGAPLDYVPCEETLYWMKCARLWNGPRLMYTVPFIFAGELMQVCIIIMDRETGYAKEIVWNLFP